MGVWLPRRPVCTLVAEGLSYRVSSCSTHTAVADEAAPTVVAATLSTLAAATRRGGAEADALRLLARRVLGAVAAEVGTRLGDRALVTLVEVSPSALRSRRSVTEEEPFGAVSMVDERNPHCTSFQCYCFADSKGQPWSTKTKPANCQDPETNGCSLDGTDKSRCECARDGCNCTS